MTQEELAAMGDDDLALALALARRALQFLQDEAARRGLTEEQIAAKTSATIDANDEQMGEFLRRIRPPGQG